MKMQACHPCHGAYILSTTLLLIPILKLLAKIDSQPRNFVKSKGQRPAPKVKVDLISSKSKEEKQVTNPKASTNKHGPKATWVPKQN